MLRDLLSSRWFQGVLAFFVLCVGGSLLYSWHVVRTTEIDMARHDRFTQGLHNPTETRPAETVNVPTETETPVLVNTPDENTEAQTRGTVRAQTSTEFSNPTGNEQQLFDTSTGPRTFSELTPEQQQEAIDQFYRDRGLEPPEPGYTYYWDEHGTAHYHKAYEPIVKIKTQMGFAPTIAQYERYRHLQELLRTAKTQGNTTKARQLSTEIAQLKQDAQGEIPTAASVVTFGAPNESIDSAKQRGIQKANEQLDKAYKERNLQHLRTKY